MGALTFELIGQLLYPSLPLPAGDRIVGVQLWDAERGRAERRVLFDYASWRYGLRTITGLGAYRTVQRNLWIDGVGVESVEVAEMTASGFRVARVSPLLGRTLHESDEEADAPAAAVIGHDVWQRRFGADPAVIGRTVLLGRMPTTIVGVMPEGFGFPIAHRMWLPLRPHAQDFERREGPSLRLFGRLADGASLAEAQAELSARGRRAAADHPDTHAHLRPQVLPYAKSLVTIPALPYTVLLSTNLLVVMLLVLICGNVALLMFARAATRESEIVVRNALGAAGAALSRSCSRKRWCSAGWQHSSA